MDNSFSARLARRSYLSRLSALTVVISASVAAAPLAAATATPTEIRSAGAAAALSPGVPAEVASSRERSASQRVAPSDFASVGRATITPGVMMYTAGAQCTANFVFTDALGSVYVGYAAHCAGKGEATDTNGCMVDSLPVGTKVDFVKGGSLISGGQRLGRGTLAYSSWLAMDDAGTTDPNTCEYNDFALVKVRPKFVKRVNPSVPYFGGPTGIDKNGTRGGETVYSYGNSSLRGGLSSLSPKTGFALGDAAADGGWNHELYTVTPGIPGDSGSGFMTRNGEAVGTLSTVAIAPLPLSNGTGDLLRELRFARGHSDIQGLRLTKGTKRFSTGG